MNDGRPTKKQALVLDFIKNFILEKDESPSYREIAVGVGLSSIASVAEHIDNLIAKGYLIKNPGAARSLEVVNRSHPETEELFHNRLKIANEEERKILLKAAKLLEVDLMEQVDN